MPLRALTFAPSPLCLPDDTPIGEVLQHMLAHRTNHVALSDIHGRHVGIISAHALLTQVLPASVRVEPGLADLGFAGDALPMLMTHFRSMASMSARTLVEPHESVLHTDTAIAEAALMLSRSPGPLPVLDDAGYLVGMLSARTLLSFIAAQASGH